MDVKLSTNDSSLRIMRKKSQEVENSLDRMLVDVLLPRPLGTGNGEDADSGDGPVELDPRLLYGEDDVGGMIGTRVYSKTREEDLKREPDMEECTFKPRVGRGPKSGLLCNGRYMIRSGKREKDIKRWKEEEDARLKKECTFAPLLRRDPVKQELEERGVFVPIQNRLATEWRKRQERIQKVKERIDADVTFQPKIDLMSRRIAERRRERGALRVERKHCHAPEEPERFTCPKSDMILEKSVEIPLDFAERQAYFSKRYRENATKREEKGHTEPVRVSKTPARLLIGSERLVHQMLESEEERIQRMCFGESQRIEEARLQRKKALDSQFSFKPELNKRSLAMNKKSNHVVPRFQKELEAYKDERYRDCTFQPDVSKPTVFGYHDVYEVPKAQAVLRDSDAYMKEIADREAKKQQKAAYLRREREAKEMEGCTFAPEINKSLPAATRCDSEILESLPGIDKYFEKVLRIERKFEGKKEREKDVFVDGSGWVNELTTPEPFSLASSRRVRV